MNLTSPVVMATTAMKLTSPMVMAMTATKLMSPMVTQFYMLWPEYHLLEKKVHLDEIPKWSEITFCHGTIYIWPFSRPKLKDYR